MKRLDAIELRPEDIEKAASVLKSEATELVELMKVGGLNPAADLRGLVLCGWRLAGQDLRGFDLSGCDLRRTGIEAAVVDESTGLNGAILDPRAQKIFGFVTNVKPGRRSPRAKPPPGGYTKVRLPSLSDAEMLDHIFLIYSPSTLENVVQDAPPVDQWLTYEGRYEVGADVTCAFAHRHRKGYVFGDEIGRRYLIGHNCGAKHFGLGNWKTFTRGRQDLEDRAGYLRLIRDLEQSFASHRNWIASLSDSQSVVAYDQLKQDLRKKLGFLIQGVERIIARGEGRFILHREERDFNAEEREREKQEKAQREFDEKPPLDQESIVRRGGRRPVLVRVERYRRVPYEIGRLQGHSLFRDDVPLTIRIKQLVSLIDHFLARPPSPQNKKALVEISRNARTLVERLTGYSEEVAQAVAFFAPDHLENLARWADERRLGAARYVASADGLRVTPDDGTRALLIFRPPLLQSFDSRPISELASAIMGRLEQAIEQKSRRQASSMKAESANHKK